MSAIFLLPVCLTYWPRKYTTPVDPHVDNSHQVWSWYDHPLPSYSVLVCRYVTRLCDPDLWPLTFRPSTAKVHDGSRANLATKVEHPTSVCSWVMSYNDSVWLPLKMRTRPLRMRRITWPVSAGQKELHFLNAWTRFGFSVCNFVGFTVKIIKVICKIMHGDVLKTAILKFQKKSKFQRSVRFFNRRAVKNPILHHRNQISVKP